MIRYSHFILLIVLVLLSSCELDNYDAPDKVLEGKVIDASNGEALQTRQPDGIKVRLLEKGYGNPVPYDFWAMPDGTFRNTKIFAAQYDILVVEGPFEQSSVEQVTVDLNTNQTVTFEVEPYVRLSNVEITSSDGKLKATYKISPSTGKRKILKSMLICSTSDILHENTTNKRSSKENYLNEIANDEISTMSFVDEIEGLQAGQTYYARVAVLTENSLSRYNYSPIVVFKF